PAPFKGTYNQKTKVGGIIVTTAMDFAPIANIPTFGICGILSKSNPVPCMPVPTMWQDTYDAKVMGQETLIFKSCMNCGVGGKMSFITSGQIPLPPDAQAELDALQGENQALLDEIQKSEEAVGEAGLVEGMIPVWGSGRDLVHSVQTGNGWGIAMNAGFLVWDVASIVAGAVSFGTGTAAMQGAKAAVKGGVKTTVKYTAKQLAKMAAKQVVKAKNVAKNIGKSVDDFVKATGKVCVYACFPAGTPISTKHGFIPIEDVKVGDWVYSYNEETGETGLRKVVKTSHKEVNALIEISLGKEKIKTTPTHPFFVNGKWVEAGDLKPGDKLTRQTRPQIAHVQTATPNVSSKHTTTPYDLPSPGESSTIVKDIKLLLNQKRRVFNFEVDGWQTYFVSLLGILVHNACYHWDKALINAGKDAIRKWKKSSRARLRRVLNTPAGQEAHHVIPMETALDNKFVQDALDQGFDLNSTVNGLNLDKVIHTDGGHRIFQENLGTFLNENRGRLIDEFGDAKTALEEYIVPELKKKIGNLDSTVGETINSINLSGL
ncbi:MAG: polymorphic toxin-type HINT domain-containing protein, partial [Bacteroidota bacterium]